MRWVYAVVATFVVVGCEVITPGQDAGTALQDGGLHLPPDSGTASRLALTVSPTELHFDVQAGSASDPKSVTLSNSGTGAVSVTSVALEGMDASGFALETETTFPHTLAPAESAVFAVRWSSTTAAAGNTHASLVFHTEQTLTSSPAVALSATISPVPPVDPPPDTTPPTVAISLAGTQVESGYQGSVAVTVVAADSGSGLAQVLVSVDGAMAIPYTAPINVTTLGTHTVTAAATDKVGLTTTAPPLAFNVVAGPAGPAVLVLSNPDAVPFVDHLAFNRIGSLSNPPPNGVHSKVTLGVSNAASAGQALVISALTLSGPWMATPSKPLPVSLSPGESLAILVEFQATSGDAWFGSLDIASNDIVTPTKKVTLGGFWQKVSEGGQEPTVQEIAKVFGYGTVITKPGEVLSQQGVVTTVGDEVLAPYWQRVDVNAPVTIRQIAQFHNYPKVAYIEVMYPDPKHTQTLFIAGDRDAQSFLPRQQSSDVPAFVSFTPVTERFAMSVDGSVYSVPALNPAFYYPNCPSVCGHQFRVWPLKDANGVGIPHSYLMVMDYTGGNNDYNDNIQVLTNVEPAQSP